jgi:ABC-type dipeptide/oligopeptide/nickel transport system ATPase component
MEQTVTQKRQELLISNDDETLKTLRRFFSLDRMMEETIVSFVRLYRNGEQPCLGIIGEMGTGKSSLLGFIGRVCPKTILIDEADDDPGRLIKEINGNLPLAFASREFIAGCEGAVIMSMRPFEMSPLTIKYMSAIMDLSLYA